MQSAQLTIASFNVYPPQARETAASQVDLLRTLPLAFLPLLLREVISFDSKFPIERKELTHQFSYLRGLPASERTRQMAPFTGLRLAPELEKVDWVNSPADFSEQLTAHLWATHQIDTFRKAAVDYVSQLNKSKTVEPQPLPRLTIAIIGQGVASSKYPLFRKLRPQGVYYKQVNPAKGNAAILALVAQRAAAHPIPFAHWYVDGGVPEQVTCPHLACLSYSAMDPIRKSLLTSMESIMKSGAGPEVLRTRLARMRPRDLGINDTVLEQFKINILTEGSGTQIYSTTFVQWTAREILRRAQPLTLVTRYSPRLQEQTIQLTIAGGNPKPVFDPEGSLRDADMGAYYTWINQQRLPDAEHSRFLVWFEDHSEALAIGPSAKPGTEHGSPVYLAEILQEIGA